MIKLDNIDTEFIKRNKESIIVGLLTSLLFLLFEKVVTFASTFIIPALVTMSSVFSNKFYHQVSNGVNSFMFIFQNYIIVFIAYLCTLIFFKILQNHTFYLRLRNKDKMLDISKRINVLMPNDSQTVKTDESIIDELKKVYAKYEEVHEKLIFKVPRKYILFIVCSIYLGMVYCAIIQDMNEKFHKECIIIKPYIKEIDYDKLQSDWFLIKNEEDYNNIDKTVNKIIREKKIPYEEY